MSRFFKGESSSDEEDEKQSESGSEQEEEEQNEEKPKGLSDKWKKGQGAASDDESGDDEPAKRTIKSAADKRYEELNNAVSGMRHFIGIADWNGILNGTSVLL
jgi:translation initiation factor 3 subunit C